MKYIILLILAFFLSTISTGFAETTSQSSKKQLVKIGVILPLTGNSATWGEAPRRGLEIIQDIFNERSSRYEYQFIFENGHCGTGNAASTAIKKLIHIDKISATLMACSGETLQAGPIAQKNKIPSLCFACSHKDIKHLGNYIFRTYIDMEAGVLKLSDLIKSQHNSLAVLTEENSFTLGIKDLLLKNLTTKVSFSDDFGENDSDLRTLLLKAKAKSPDAYYLNAASPASYQNLLKQIKNLGIKEPLYSYFSPGDKDSLSNLKKLQDGIIYLDVPDLEIGTPLFQLVYDRYLTKHPEGPNIPFLLRTSFEAASAILNTIEAVGINQNLIIKNLYGSEHEGSSGKIHFNKNGDIVGLNFDIKQIYNGLPKRLSGS